MKIVFVTDIYNHHQAEVAKKIYHLTDGEYTYITTKSISEERKKLGWGKENTPQFVISYHECVDKCKKDILFADIVIYGSVPFSIVKDRVCAGKITFCYSERAYKNIIAWLEYPLRALKYRYEGGKYKNVYLLAASAYATYDYRISGCFKNRTFKWGYFPPFKKYENITNLIEEKKPISFVWAGRFIKWKHPELVIRAVQKLKNKGYDIELTMIGTGKLLAKMQTIVDNAGLNSVIKFTGAISPECVRENMEKASIFLATSDYNEGWGAVINEAMNSGCAVIASHAIGAAPFLIQDEKNGLLFNNRDINDLVSKCELVINDVMFRKELGLAAYNTVAKCWNGRIAAERIVALSSHLLNANDEVIFSDGPCSPSIPLTNYWYKK